MQSCEKVGFSFSSHHTDPFIDLNEAKRGIMEPPLANNKMKMLQLIALSLVITCVSLSVSHLILYNDLS